MHAYLRLLREVMERGVWKPQRAALSDGTRPRAKSLFGAQARYDLREGFPLVTTKRMSFRIVAEELAWFLSGSTNVGPLEERGVRIWSAWAGEDGDLGPIYGKAWRRWGYGGESGRAATHDQIAALQSDIRAVAADPEHPAGRRLILTAWNPPEMRLCRGPSACHTLSQFNVTGGRLSCHLYQRSADMFLGVPYNIASYALLTHLFARAAGLGVGELIHSFGDAHVYENHVGQVEEQLTREPLGPCTLTLSPAVLSVDDFTGCGGEGWASVSDYRCLGALKGEVAV